MPTSLRWEEDAKEFTLCLIGFFSASERENQKRN